MKANLEPPQVALAHLNSAQSVASATAFKEGGDTLALQSYDIIALRLQQLLVQS